MRYTESESPCNPNICFTPSPPSCSHHSATCPESPPLTMWCYKLFLIFLFYTPISISLHVLQKRIRLAILIYNVLFPHICISGHLSISSYIDFVSLSMTGLYTSVYHNLHRYSPLIIKLFSCRCFPFTLLKSPF